LARLGQFDPEIVPQGIFDPTDLFIGWVDRDFIPILAWEEVLGQAQVSSRRRRTLQAFSGEDFGGAHPEEERPTFASLFPRARKRVSAFLGVEDFAGSLPWEEGLRPLPRARVRHLLVFVEPEDFAGSLPLEEPASVQRLLLRRRVSAFEEPEDFAGSLPLEEPAALLRSPLRRRAIAFEEPEDFAGSLPLEEPTFFRFIALRPRTLSRAIFEDFAGSLPFEEDGVFRRVPRTVAFVHFEESGEDFAGALVTDEEGRPAFLVRPRFHPAASAGEDSGFSAFGEEESRPARVKRRVSAFSFDTTELLPSPLILPLPLYGTGAYLSREEYEWRRGLRSLEALWGRYRPDERDYPLGEWDTLGLGDYRVGEPVDLVTFERRVLLAQDEDDGTARFGKKVNRLHEELLVSRKIRGIFVRGAVVYVVWKVLTRS
jgi:hypothetical protein